MVVYISCDGILSIWLRSGASALKGLAALTLHKLITTLLLTHAGVTDCVDINVVITAINCELFRTVGGMLN